MLTMGERVKVGLLTATEVPWMVAAVAVPVIERVSFTGSPGTKFCGFAERTQLGPPGGGVTGVT